MQSRNVRIISVPDIERNMRLIRSSVPDSAGVMAVVKADGYGHGAVETARASIRGGATMLAVATADEGIELRRAGIEVPILILGAATASDAYKAVDYGLTQTVCSPDMVRICESAAAQAGKKAEVHIAFDTGMGRIGIRTENERDAVLNAISTCAHIVPVGAFTHFADADGDESGAEYTKSQFRRFLELTEVLPRDMIRHCCNSAAIHRFPEMALDMVRAGISLYGYPPVRAELPLHPCMQWHAEISYIKELPAGAFVSYGRTWKADRTVRVGTVTCGYGDGYHRAAGKKGYVLVCGKKAKILGRVCMDQMMVDLSGIPEAAAGETAVLMGESGEEEITAEDLAAWCGTISYEILLSTGTRPERIYRY